MFNFRNCENGHSLVINSHLLNPDIQFAIIIILNQGNEVRSAGSGLDLIRGHLFSADPAVPQPPTHPSRPPQDKCEISTTGSNTDCIPSTALCSLGGQGSGRDQGMLSKETESFYLFASNTVGNICFLFSFFFFH